MQNTLYKIGLANVSDSFKEKVEKSDGVTYWWPVISWYSAIQKNHVKHQCFVPSKAMYYRKSCGVNKLKNMFLERK